MAQKKTAEEAQAESEFEALVGAFDGYATYEEYVNSSEKLDAIPGHALLTPGQLKAQPFVITAIHFRPSDLSDRGYVSLEIMAQHDGAVVINDGSTGIRAQILTYCVQKGWAVPIAQEDGDQLNQDSPYFLFEWNSPAERKEDSNGFTTVHIVGIRLHCPRGTRDSNYKYMDASDGREKPATTWYLA